MGHSEGMRGSVDQLPSGAWRLRVDNGRKPDGSRDVVTRTHRGTRNSADLALAHLLVEVGQGHHLAYRDHTVGDLIDAWFEASKISPTTRPDYRSVINKHIKPAIGKQPLHKLQAAQLDHLYVNLERKGLGPARIRRVHSIISTALAQGVKWQWVVRNVSRDASPPPVPRKKPKAPTPQQVKQLIAAADGEMVTYLRLSAILGTRRGEVVGLRWSEVDTKARIITVNRAIGDGGKGVGLVEKGTKTDRDRRVSIDAATAKMLKDHRKMVAARALAAGVQLQADGFVFSRDAAGVTPWRPEYPTDTFAEIREGLGLPASIKMRQLRHFVATQMLARGADLRTVAERLGHGRTSTTQDFYQDYLPVNDRKAADDLGKLLG